MADMDGDRVKRLRHRSRYRGFLEIDIILGRFADTRLTGLSSEELDAYEALLDEPDHDIYAWVTRSRPVPARHDNDIMKMLQKLDLAKP